MIDQLILQRNKSGDIMTCEGLYFPKAYVHSSVVKFEVTWSDSELMFTVDSEPLLESKKKEKENTLIYFLRWGKKLKNPKKERRKREKKNQKKKNPLFNLKYNARISQLPMHAHFANSILCVLSK